MESDTNENPYDFYKVLTSKWIISLEIIANFQKNGKIWISLVDKSLLSDRKNTV